MGQARERDTMGPVRIKIIANPIAGGGRGEKGAEQLLTELGRRGIRAELFLTKARGDAKEQAAKLDPAEWDGVLVVGGDGSLNAVLNGLQDPSLPIGQLPMGTANVLACELHLPRHPARVADMIAAHQLRRTAIGVAEGRRFLLFLGAGIDGHIVHRVEAVRRGPLGKMGWTGPILHSAWHWPTPELQIELEDGEVIPGCSQVLVTKVRNYGGIMRMPAGIELDDGPFHVLCFHQTSRLAYGVIALRALLGRLRPGKECSWHRARALEIRSDEPVPCQVDGDGSGHTPKGIRMESATAQLIVPRL